MKDRRQSQIMEYAGVEDKGFALFVVWHDAIPWLSEIDAYLSSAFEIVLRAKVTWSEEFMSLNANRLYCAPVFRENQPYEFFHKIKKPTFHAFVVRDHHPSFGHVPSVSGKIEVSNLNVVSAKKRLREIVKESTGEEYAVHSTANLGEFLFQAPLIFGPKLFEEIIGGKPLDFVDLRKDLEGTGGWESPQQLLNILNISTNYLVQRGFEELMDGGAVEDLDLLTDDFQRLASIIGGLQSPDALFKSMVRIEGAMVPVDIRFVGDGYYHPVWAQKMLERRQFNGSIFRPSKEDYFFSLLFHCKVQKDFVKPDYVPILKQLSLELGYDSWFSTDDLGDDLTMGQILGGYLESEHYYFSAPLDDRVFENKNVTRQLPRAERFIKRQPLTFRRRMKNLLPDPIFQFLKAGYKLIKPTSK